jgi:hypothetical protein
MSEDALIGFVVLRGDSGGVGKAKDERLPPGWEASFWIGEHGVSLVQKGRNNHLRPPMFWSMNANRKIA